MSKGAGGMTTMREAVKDGYARVAREGLSSDDAAIKRVARAFGYGEADLAAVPAEANMGLSCGNPVALASLKPGETVLDLGCGGGLDTLLAARAVGPRGRAIGIDMTEDMVALARRNAATGGFANVTFHHAPIEALPIESDSVDCVISNCVLNLVEDKDAALAEVFRVLKPGGRLAVSDIALLRPLPREVARDVTAWVSCIAGAITIEDNLATLGRAGFASAQVVPTGADLNVYKEASQGSSCCAPPAAVEPEPACCEPKTAASATGGCCAPKPAAPSSCCGGAKPQTEATAPSQTASGFHAELAGALAALDLNDYAAAVRIFAVKP
jgi:arsenite methyltransferase